MGRGIEVATNVRWSEVFQSIENAALTEHLETKKEDSSDGRAHRKIPMND